jgi:hypothetical protein
MVIEPPPVSQFVASLAPVETVTKSVTSRMNPWRSVDCGHAPRMVRPWTVTPRAFSVNRPSFTTRSPPVTRTSRAPQSITDPGMTVTVCVTTHGSSSPGHRCTQPVVWPPTAQAYPAAANQRPAAKRAVLAPYPRNRTDPRRRWSMDLLLGRTRLL